MPHTLTQGALGDLGRCETLFFLKRIRKIRRIGYTPALAVGNSYHVGIEKRSASAASRHFLETRNHDFEDRAARLRNEFDAARVHAMVEAALSKWGDDWPEDQEVEFALQIVNPSTGYPTRNHVFRGVVDGWPSTDPSSSWCLALGEWKTSSQPSSDYFLRLKIDLQISAYCEAASVILGEPVRSVRYRVIRKPTIDPRKGETVDEYNERCRNRAPLAPLKRKELKSRPKDGVDVDGITRRDDGTEYEQTLSGAYRETPGSWRLRNKVREAARPPLERKVPESPREYLERLRAWYRAEDRCVEEVVTRTDAQLSAFRREMWEIHKRALALESGRRLPVRNPHACIQYGRACDFLGLCSGELPEEAFTAVESAYPELRDTED